MIVVSRPHGEEPRDRRFTQVSWSVVRGVSNTGSRLQPTSALNAADLG